VIAGVKVTAGVTVITGGASGMGEATVRLLASRGQNVVFGDIQDDRGYALAAELGDSVRYVHADLASEPDVARLIDTAVASFGPLAGMVNNAGVIGVVGPIDVISVDDWDATIAMLLRSVFLGMKHAARVMKPQRSGAIVNTSSIAALRGGIGAHAYAAAKAGVCSLTVNGAAELGSFGIRVNAVAPGRIATPMVADTWAGSHEDIEAAKDAIRVESPLADRVGIAEDIAEAYAWLLSAAAGYVSGQVLCVDGGYIGGTPPSPVAAARLARYAGKTEFIREAGKRGSASVPSPA
jgi:NAD(P)-dependent dehydrogenase (short-subunit alcohol dehydrogenase family)